MHKKLHKPFTDLMISIIPERVGIYSLMDKDGEVIYIGVAKNPGGLRRELRKHYFRIHQVEVKEAYDFETEVCDEPIDRYEQALAEFESEFDRLPRYNQSTISNTG